MTMFSTGLISTLSAESNVKLERWMESEVIPPPLKQPHRRLGANERDCFKPWVVSPSQTKACYTLQGWKNRRARVIKDISGF